jgi:hypothetical protein
MSPRAWLLFNAKVGSLTFGMGAITPMYERAVTILLQQMRGHPWATAAVAAGASWLHARRVLSPLPLMAAAGVTCWVVFATLSSH